MGGTKKAMRLWYNGITSAFQAEDTGSIPVGRLVLECNNGTFYASQLRMYQFRYMLLGNICIIIVSKSRLPTLLLAMIRIDRNIDKIYIN